MPGGGGYGVLFPGSADFVNECQCRDHLGEALIVLQEADDEVGGRVDGNCGNKIDGSGGEIM